jgi:hypothetical protein
VPWRSGGVVISLVVISKDEPQLELTLQSVAAQMATSPHACELIVVDASCGRLDHIRLAHPGIRWLDFETEPRVGVSIAHQRNAGVRAAGGEIVVFIDCGCVPATQWLSTLLEPILRGEAVSVGRAVGRGPVDLYDSRWASTEPYLRQCATTNVGLRREVFDAVGGFDESFAYGSDIDFSWRLVDAGFRLRNTREAIVTVDWGSSRRQLRRAWEYGRARAHLYRKHPRRIVSGCREDPVPFAYATFLLGLPLAAVFPAYPGLLVLPALRNRGTGALLTVADHLLIGAGFLRELVALGQPAQDLR